jgi:hypothetical protein
MYSMSDLYPAMYPELTSTTEESIPELEENQQYQNTQVDTGSGKVAINKSMVLGSVGLIFGVMILIGVLNRLGVN